MPRHAPARARRLAARVIALGLLAGLTAAPSTLPALAADPEGPIAAAADRVLIQGGTEWRWRYATGAWPAGWSGTQFDDAGWGTGSAALGFGSTTIATNIDVPPPTSSRPLAALFRRTFQVADASVLSSLRITTRADDGIVVRVNGTEVGRHRISPGVVSSSTYANAAVRTSAATAAPVSFDVPAGLLVDGANVVAVSTHVNYRATPDLSFDLVLTATESTEPPPPLPAETESFAVIGDVPYGGAQIDDFPRMIEHINADPDVWMASHIGDLSSPLNCSDEYFAGIKARFDSFQDPLVYTPGDNEWTDCSRAAVGAGNPLERLDSLRATFFAQPGTTLGAPAAVVPQPGYPENVRFERADVTFATLHLVGSNNGRNTWNGEPGPTEAQLAEVQARTQADIMHLRAAFEQATADGSRGVVLLTQADMFAPGSSSSEYRTAFQPFVRALADEAGAFGKPVLLINGDTHAYASDKPLTATAWLSFYGVAAPVPNLSRVTVLGGTSEWTKVDIVGGSDVFSARRVPLPLPPPTGELARDSFPRSVAGGWGSAEAGGPWTVSGASSDFTVANGSGGIRVPAGGNRAAVLGGVSTTAAEVRATLAFPRPSASSVYVSLIGRQIGASTYGARVVVGSTGSVRLELQRNSDTGLPVATVAGLNHATGDRLHFRLQVTGTSPTTLRAKVWEAGTPEPSGWRLTVTDSAAALQAAGSVGVAAYLSRTAAPNPLTVTFDDFLASRVG